MKSVSPTFQSLQFVRCNGEVEVHDGVAVVINVFTRVAESNVAWASTSSVH
jgi:hypothetical protein